MLECRAAIEAKTGDAQHREFHGQHLARLATGKVRGCSLHGTDFAVGESAGVKARGFLRIAVIPEAKGIFLISSRVISPGH